MGVWGTAMVSTRWAVAVVGADQERNGKNAGVDLCPFGTRKEAESFAIQVNEYEMSRGRLLGGYPDNVFIYDLADSAHFADSEEKVRLMEEFGEKEW